MTSRAACAQFEEEGFLKRDMGEALPDHFVTCRACLEVCQKYDRIAGLLSMAALGEAPPDGWKARVLEMIDRAEGLPVVVAAVATSTDEPLAERCRPVSRGRIARGAVSPTTRHDKERPGLGLDSRSGSERNKSVLSTPAGRRDGSSSKLRSWILRVLAIGMVFTFVAMAGTSTDLREEASLMVAESVLGRVRHLSPLREVWNSVESDIGTEVSSAPLLISPAEPRLGSLSPIIPTSNKVPTYPARRLVPTPNIHHSAQPAQTKPPGSIRNDR